MNELQLIFKLNWFYSLEITQVENYIAQSRAVGDRYISKGLERVAQIEQGHADNIRQMLVVLGSKPALFGSVLAPVLGTAFGDAVRLSDVAAMMGINIKVEAKAAADYKKLIQALGPQGEPEMLRVLEYNMTDEDLHSCWFSQVIAHLDVRPWPLSPTLAKEGAKKQREEVTGTKPS